MTNDNTYAGGDGYPYGYGDGSDRAHDPYQDQIPGGNDHSHGHTHDHGRGYVPEYGSGYDHGGFGYGQGDAYGYGYGYDFAAGPADEGHYVPGPAEGWGGEYDADATGFVQIPAGGWPALDPQAGEGAEAYGDPLAGPLAAPGTGQGGYTPPPIEVTQPGAASRGPAGADGMGGGPLTPGATTDPAMTGHWLLPYQAETPHMPAAYEASEVPPGPGLPESSESDSGDGEPGSTAAAMGQGAAAALAGSHEARTKRRPLGEGGAAGVLPPDAFEPQPQSPPQAQHHSTPLSEPQPSQSEAPGQAAHLSDELFADAHARRQVPFEGGPSDTGVAAAEAQDAEVREAGFGHGAYAEPFASAGQEEQQRTGSAEPVEQPLPEPGASAAGSSGGSAIPWTPSVPERTAGALPVSGAGWGGNSGDTFAGAMPENGATQNEPVPGEPDPAQPAPGEPTMEGHDPDHSAMDPLATEPAAMSEPAPGEPAPGEPAPGEPGPGEPGPGGPASGSDAVPGEPSDPAQPQAAPSWGEPVQTGQAEPEWSEPGVPAQGQRGLADFDAMSQRRPVAGKAAEAVAGHQPVPGQAWPVTGETGPGQQGAPQESPDQGDPAPADSVPAPADQRPEPGPEGPAPSVPAQTVPQQAVSEQAVAEAAVPEGAVPDGAVPGQAMPQRGDSRGDPAPEASAAADVPAQTRPTHDADAQEVPGHEAPASGEFEAAESGSMEVPADEAAVPAPVGDEHPHTSYVLHVNGVDRPVTHAWIGESLLYVLRERLGLAGAKDGCSQGECGACSVQVDGRLVASCLVPAATSAGTEIRTVEGLAADGTPSDVQRALVDCGAVQCGFCVPGLAMTVHDLLEGNHAPSELETRTAICGNLCRCSGYSGVLDAVRTVVDERRARAAREAEESAEQHEQQHSAEAAGHPEPARIPQQGGPGGGMHHPGGGGA